MIKSTNYLPVWVLTRLWLIVRLAAAALPARTNRRRRILLTQREISTLAHVAVGSTDDVMHDKLSEPLKKSIADNNV